MEVQQTERDLLILGEAVREVREQRGFSVSELAAGARVAKGRVVALEEGQLDPDYELLLTLAQSIGVPPSAFILHAEDLGGGSA